MRDLLLRLALPLWLVLAPGAASAAVAVDARAEPPPAGEGLDLLTAVRSTLALLPDIQVARQDVAYSRGSLQVALGQFDYTLRATLGQAGATTPLSPDAVTYNQYLLDQYRSDGLLTDTTTSAEDRSTSYTTSWSLGLSKQLRSGLLIAPSISLSFQDPRSLNYTYPNLTAAAPNQGTATVNFRLVQPLLRGRGADATAAQERAARGELEAAEHQLRQTAARKVLEAALAYWDYAVAYETVAALRQAEQRAAGVLSNEEKLVRGGEHPAAELMKLEANRAESRAARQNAERALVQARQALGVAMGLPWRDIGLLAPPADALAPLSAGALPSEPEVEALVARACQERPDRRAQGASLRAAEALARGARRGLDPQLDLELDLGYTGLTQGGASPLITAVADSVRGVNFSGQLTFSYPVRNHAARGVLLQREAVQRRAALLLGDLDRRIGAGVALAVAELRSEILALETAEAGAAAYRVAAANEEKRLRAGLATLFDLLVTQERLTNAELLALRGRGAVAAALVRLRYESGTLLAARGADLMVTREQLTTVPVP